MKHLEYSFYYNFLGTDINHIKVKQKHSSHRSEYKITFLKMCLIKILTLVEIIINYRLENFTIQFNIIS